MSEHRVLSPQEMALFERQCKRFATEWARRGASADNAVHFGRIEALWDLVECERTGSANLSKAVNQLFDENRALHAELLSLRGSVPGGSPTGEREHDT